MVEPAITTKTCRFASSSGAGASLMARCRSTFRDWGAGSSTNHPREVAEVALAHIVANATERSYQRGDLFDKRRTLMDMGAVLRQKPVASESRAVVAMRR